MTYEEYYNQWQLSVESRDLAFDEWLCLMLNRQKKLDIDKGCEFLKQQGKDWWEGYGIPFSIEDYRKAMMEEQK